MAKSNSLEQLAEKVLNDPVLLRRLTDRVYRLMQDEVRSQRERQGY